MRFLKSNLIGFITGILLGSSLVYASTIISGSNITYDNSTSGISSSNVQDALDELNTKTNFGNADDSNILSGKTALVGGKKITGTMSNNTGSTGITLTSSDTRPVTVVKRESTDSRIWYLANSDGNNRLNIGIPKDGYYNNKNILAINNDDLTSVLGITADKIITGQSIAGVSGTAYGSFASSLIMQGFHYGIQSRTWIPNLSSIYKYVTITYKGTLYGASESSNASSTNGTKITTTSPYTITLASESYNYFGWGGTAGSWSVEYHN